MAQMTIEPTSFDGIWSVSPFFIEDRRGSFCKFYDEKLFAEKGLENHFTESYYSVSHRNVIRGMHFQIPPFDHAKLVYVSKGSITDVILDLRAGSPTFRQYFQAELNVQNHTALYMAKGFAHGFQSHEDDTIVTYLQTSPHELSADKGVLFNSFGYDWKVEKPIMSDRDLSFPTLEAFQTPFIYSET